MDSLVIKCLMWVGSRTILEDTLALFHQIDLHFAVHTPVVVRFFKTFDKNVLEDVTADGKKC